MAQDIRHQGTVDSIDGQKVNVRITQSSACGGCQARNICRAAESKEKVVQVLSADAAALHVGQEVTVAGAESLGLRAVALAFGLPLLFLMAGLITAMALTGSEKVAALCALVVLAPYYMVLFLCRNRIKRDFRFRIII